MFTGQIPPFEVKNEIEWADIYIQPSIQEGFCNAALEAMALGISVISTDSDDMGEVIRNGKNSFLVPVMDAESMAKTIWNFIDLDEMEKTILFLMPGKQLFIIIYFLIRLMRLNPFRVKLSKDYEQNG